MAITVDEYHGVGGSYVIDPKTGKRKLIAQEAAPASSTPKPEVTSNGSDEKATDPGED
jgi:hypothetical protein